MPMTNLTAKILFILAIVMLVGSIAVVLDRGITPLTGVDSMPANPATLAPVPTFGIGVTNNPSSPATTPSTPPPNNPLSTATPAGARQGTPQAITPQAVGGPALGQSDRELFDTANNQSLETTVQFQLDVRLTFAAESNGQKQQTQLALNGKGYAIPGGQPFSLLMDTSGTYSDGKSTSRFNLNLRFTQGVLYLKGDSPDTGRATPWLAYSLNNMLFSGAGIPLLDSKTGQASGKLDISGLPAFNSDQARNLLNALDFGKFVRTSRLPDIDQSTAEFSTTIDLVSLLTSPDLANLLAGASALLGGSQGVQQAQNFVQNAPVILPQIVKKFDLKIGHIVNKDKRLVSRVTLLLDVNIDLSAVTAQANTAAGADASASFTTRIDGTLSLSDYGGKMPPVTPPPGAVKQN